MRLRKIANLRVGFEKDGKDYEWGFLSKIHWHASFLCRDL